MDISRPCQPEKLIPSLPWPGFDPSFSGHNDRRAITSEWTRLRLKPLSHRGWLTFVWSTWLSLKLRFLPITPLIRRKALLLLGDLGRNMSRPLGHTDCERGLQYSTRVFSSTGRSATFFSDLPSRFRKVQCTSRVGKGHVVRRSYRYISLNFWLLQSSLCNSKTTGVPGDQWSI